MIRFLKQFLVLSCVATVISLLLGIGFAWQKGMLAHDKIVKVAALFHNIDIQMEEGGAAIEPGEKEQMSYVEQDRLRMTVSKNLDLKTQSLGNGLSGLAFARRKLENDVTNFDRRLNSFEAELDKKRGVAQEKGFVHLRAIWQKMEPQRVKNHILKMIDEEQLEDVVVLLSDMDNDKRVKIFNEFNSRDNKELEVLSDILDKIRRGDPEESVIKKTLEELRDGGTTAQSP